MASDFDTTNPLSLTAFSVALSGDEPERTDVDHAAIKLSPAPTVDETLTGDDGIVK